MVAIPRSSASCFISSILTGMPAFKKFMEMPPPMVPAPMTATDAMLRLGVSSGTSAILEAALSAMKMWRRARDSGVIMRLVKISRSKTMPSSNFFLVAASTASTHLGGAGKFLAMPLTMLRANWKYASPCGCLQGKLRTNGKGEPSACWAANSLA